MNNPLAQKYNYYLNESNRLNEELKSEEAYSELLENVLFELLGEEDFTKLFEYVLQGTMTRSDKTPPFSGKSDRLTPEQSDRRIKRVQQIIDIGKKAKSYSLRDRVANSLVAKGIRAANDPDVGKIGEKDTPHEVWSDRRKHHIKHALEDGKPLRADLGGGGEKEEAIRTIADKAQKSESKRARDPYTLWQRANAKREEDDRNRNTFK